MLRILIRKRYALPFRVVDALVHHFCRFTLDPRDLPVLWHQCLLVSCCCCVVVVVVVVVVVLLLFLLVVMIVLLLLFFPSL